MPEQTAPKTSWALRRPIKGWQQDIHAWARSKGWWEDGERNIPEQLALMHSEISEALEAWRSNGLERWEAITDDQMVSGMPFKPEGFGPELADCVIRIMDTCQRYGIDLEREIMDKMDYNATRPYRHGNKRA